MLKKKTSKKQDLCLDDLPIVSPRKGLKTKKFNPKDRLSDPEFVAIAFFQALADNDTEAALDALDGYLLAVGKPELAKRADLPPSTIYHALSKGANPTLKTLARLIHAAAA